MNLSYWCMRLCILLVSRLGIIDLINKIISFWNFYNFCSSLKSKSKHVIIFGNITWINTFIVVRKKSDANLHVFLRCAKSKTYMKMFFSFLFFISKAYNMRWKILSLFFDTNASFSFYGTSKFFRLCVLSIFFKIFEFSKANKLFNFL